MSARWSQEVYIKAWDFATLAHHGQTYGSPIVGQRIDYINHIGSVAMEVIWALSVDQVADENLAVQCALLHDVIEDTNYTYHDIAQQFGQAVADGVSALTKDSTLDNKTQQMQDSLQRIQQQPKEIWRVKLADRIMNLAEPPHYWTREKRIEYCAEANMILHALAACDSVLVTRLAEKIKQYQQYINAA